MGMEDSALFNGFMYENSMNGVAWGPYKIFASVDPVLTNLLNFWGSDSTKNII